MASVEDLPPKIFLAACRTENFHFEKSISISLAA